MPSLCAVCRLSAEVPVPSCSVVAGVAAFSGSALRVSARTLSVAKQGGAERPGDGCPCVGAEEICGTPPPPVGTRANTVPLCGLRSRTGGACTFLKRHQGARSEARAGAPVGAKEECGRLPTHVPSRARRGGNMRHPASPCRSEGEYRLPSGATKPEPQPTSGTN